MKWLILHKVLFGCKKQMRSCADNWANESATRSEENKQEEKNKPERKKERRSWIKEIKNVQKTRI